jgi:quercetin dioxygenase-like cupin family protein
MIRVDGRRRPDGAADLDRRCSTEDRRSAKGDPVMTDVGVILRKFDSPDEARDFPLGRFELVRLGGITIGRATYEPGWRWSQHVGPSLGLTRCPVEHVGLVVSGTATAAFDDETVVELQAGQLFFIPSTPHDSWVVGNEPYVSLHFLGAEHYATANG